MRPGGWREAEELYQAALALRLQEREAFLAEACGANGALRAEVTRLLAEQSTAVMPEPETNTLTERRDGAAHVEAGANWGPFQLMARVGQGSFGVVYRAYDSVLQREVALKLLLVGALPEGEQAAALREARAMAKVRHPNILPVYGVDAHDGRPGFWTDFVHGKTLSAVVAEQGPFGPREVAHIGIDVGKALSAVHAAGMLHRDVKASNVMREQGGRILLMDFGLTHLREAQTGLAGTLPYMAPELLRGEAATPATDIFAAGVLLYYLLTGRHPFNGNSVMTLRAAHEAGERKRLMDARPDLPSPLARVIEKAIEPDPAKRYTSAGELIEALTEASGLAGSPAEPKPKKWGRQVAVSLAAALALAGAIYYSGSANRLLPGAANAHADYLQAQDLLDHYYKPHSVEGAVALFRKAVEKDPTSASGYAGLGRALWQRYRDTRDSKVLEEARSASGHALELDADTATARVTLAMIYTEAGRLDVADEELKKALGVNSRSADAWAALGEMYQKQGRTEQVEATLQKAVDLEPKQWRYLNQLGLYYFSVGKNAEAAQQFQQAVKLNPDNPRAWNNLGLALRRLNRLGEAQTAYEKSLELEPVFGTLSNLGTILQFQGKDAEAVEVYRRAAAMNPTSYVIWGNLASAQNRTPGGKQAARETYRKAAEVAEQALVNSPQDAATIAMLGSFYASLGVAEKSAPLLRQAAALAPGNPQVLYRIAEGYELLQRRSDALSWSGAALTAGLPRETIERNPELAALRADPRFGKLTKPQR